MTSIKIAVNRGNGVPLRTQSSIGGVPAMALVWVSPITSLQTRQVCAKMNDDDARFASYVRLFLNTLKRELDARNIRHETADEAIAYLAERDINGLRKIIDFAISRTFDRTIPETPLGDRIYTHRRFVMRLWRLPTGNMWFHDVMYRIKTGDEITNPLRVFVSDKEFSKLYIKATVGEKYVVPTIDVLRSAEQVDDYDFPETCVLKPTHGYAEIIFRIDGEELDRSKIKSWFGMNFYQGSREANYKTLKPKVIIEPFVAGLERATDYKFFCVDGEPRTVFVNDYQDGVKTRRYLDLDWNELPFVEYGVPLLEKEVPCPENFAEMIDITRKLSTPFGFVRTDLYSDGKTCKVGELTNCHAAGDRPFVPKSDHLAFSKLLFG